MGFRFLVASAACLQLGLNAWASSCVEGGDSCAALDSDGDTEESSLLMHRRTRDHGPFDIFGALFVTCTDVPVDDMDGGAYACFKGSVQSPKPLFVFGHGDGLRPSDYRLLMGALANKGFLAIGYNSCLDSESNNLTSACRGGGSSFLEILKIILAISSAPGHQLQGLPPGNMNIPVTVGGHSTGGRASLMAAAVSDSTSYLKGTMYEAILAADNRKFRKAAEKIGAAIALHPDPMYNPLQNPDVPGFIGAISKIPTLIVCSVGDDALPTDSCWYDFRNVWSPNRIYLNLESGGHTEILFPGVEAPYVADFGLAFAANNQGSRDTLYGDCGACMKNSVGYGKPGQKNNGNGTVGLLLCSDFEEDWPKDGEYWCENPLQRGNSSTVSE